MINKLITACIRRNKRLIIPTLGAFIKKNIDGVGVVLVFVPFLKNDDGVLLSAIKSWAGVEEEDGKQIMNEYISAIKETLDTRGKYLIEGIGTLKYDANHILYLEKESAEQAAAPKAEESTLVAAEPEKPAEKPIEAAVETTESIKTEPIAPIVAESAAAALANQEQEEAPKQETEAPINEPEAEITPEPEIVAPQESEPEEEPEAEEIKDEIIEEPEIEQPISRPIQKPIEQVAEEPKFPLPNRPRHHFEQKRERPTDMGTRYFTPRRSEATEPQNDEQPTAPQRERRTTPNQEIASPQRADVNSVFSRGGRDQSRINNIYGSSNSQRTTTAPTIPPREKSEAKKVVGQPKRPMPGKRPAQRNPNKKKKGNDIVLWIAVIAVILTVIVLIYGFMHGGEQTLEPMYDDTMEMTSGDSL